MFQVSGLGFRGLGFRCGLKRFGVGIAGHIFPEARM